METCSIYNVPELDGGTHHVIGPLLICNGLCTLKIVLEYLPNIRRRTEVAAHLDLSLALNQIRYNTDQGDPQWPFYEYLFGYEVDAFFCCLHQYTARWFFCSN
ncbi:unnamed protein product [Amoebophrya sp. A25]|nr:unnamed protein product [Amoebophrya sp. A25]|eukprot:GSA25T00019596001.1